MNDFKLTKEGVAFIQQWEGFKAHAYWDDTGHKWTIGYGHTAAVNRDMVCTKAQALKWLEQDANRVGKYLNTLNANMTQARYDALTDFAYNVGLGNLKKSTLLKLVLHSAPAELVAAELYKWNKSGGKVLESLVLRREGEAMLYTTGKYPSREDAIVHIDKRIGKHWRQML